MPANVLVIVVDGLRASPLGAYGNTSFPTPTLDRLAAESLLVEWCYSPSAGLPDVYRALWNSCSTCEDSGTSSLPLLLSRAGYATTLLTDDASLNSLTSASDFNEIIDTSRDWHQVRRRADIAETEMARALAAATDQIADAANPRLLWVHTRGMYGMWDAPSTLQQMLLDDDDVAPIDSVNPPDIIINDNDDPDLVFRYGCAYAAQVIALDECLSDCLEMLDTSAGDWIVTLIGARGFPLGEHRKIGGTDRRMYAEQLHVPWLIRFPDRRSLLTRVSALASHCDLPPTLADVVDADHKLGQQPFMGASVTSLATGRRVSLRDAAISATACARSIRTAAWCLREDIAEAGSVGAPNESAATYELYVRPDDRWEANDVAKLCPDVVEELRASFGSS